MSLFRSRATFCKANSCQKIVKVAKMRFQQLKSATFWLICPLNGNPERTLSLFYLKTSEQNYWRNVWYRLLFLRNKFYFRSAKRRQTFSLALILTSFSVSFSKIFLISFFLARGNQARVLTLTAPYFFKEGQRLRRNLGKTSCIP